MPGVGRPADLLDQPVVAAAAADAGLRAERVGRELEHRARVVVEPAHERARRPRRRWPTPSSSARDRLEVLAVVVVEAVQQPRRAGHHAPRAGVVGVERAQRVEVDPRDDLGRRARPRARAGTPAAPRGSRAACRACRASRSAAARRGSRAPRAARRAAGSTRRRRPGRRSRSPRCRSARTGGSGPSAGARGGRSSTGTRASPAAAACACRARGRRGRPARCPRGAA